jgi:glycosyltransferase involved in cell wall biosynthesis
LNGKPCSYRNRVVYTEIFDKMGINQFVSQTDNGIKTEKPLISVVTCFLNVEQFLVESIESIINQKYSQWELLLVDDGSKDKSTEIAKAYSEKYPNIFYLEHEGHLNHGLSASRILALKHAKGDIISFLDGDDIWTPDFMTNALGLKLEHQVPVYCEATKYWFSWKFPEKKDKVSHVGVDGNRIYYPPELIYRLYPLSKGTSPGICAVLVDRQTLEKHGGFNAAFKGMYEDQVFLTKMFLNEKIYISTDCNNIYRQRYDSLVYTSMYQGTYHQNRKFFLKWFEQYLNQIKNTDNKLKAMLNKALFPYKYPKLFFIKETLPLKIKKKFKKISTKFNP